MVRKLLIFGLLAGSLAAPAAAVPVSLMPGVTYDRQVAFTRHGPVVLHVLTAPKPGGLYDMTPVLSNGTIVGRDTVTSMQRTASATATVAGVNGDLFNFFDGHPSGVLMQAGVLKSPPQGGRSSLGIDAAGLLHVDRISFFGTWQGAGQRRPLGGFNQPPVQNEVTLYTPAWGRATPITAGAYEVVLDPFPATLPNVDLSSTVVTTAQGGNTRIPATGAVLMARGTQASKLAAEAPIGQTITSRLILKPDWTGILQAIGGGPILVRDGAPIYRAFEEFSADQLAPRNPRTAVGQLADGRIVLVAVDGRQPGYSVGVTNFELAQSLVRLHAVNAMALDAGGSTTMAFDAKLLNRPSDPGGERAVSDAFLISYYGVYAPPAAAPVLSPNGDGVDERQALSYRVVRPSTVTAKLVDPDGVARYTKTGPLKPGRYAFNWPGRRPGGGPEVEGRWHWVVTALDDQGQSSAIDRGFWLNRTIGFLRTRPSTLRLRSSGRSAVQLTVKVEHPARVSVTVETPTGAVVAKLANNRTSSPSLNLRWNGRDATGSLVHSGSYAIRVAATNRFGRADLTRTVSVHRVAGPRRAKVFRVVRP